MLGPSLTPIPDGMVRAARTREPLVDGWWASTSSGSGPIVPDGAVDVIWTPGRTPFVAGPDRAPRPSGLAAGRRVIGIRLRVGVASAVLRDGVDRATGIAVALDEVWTRSDVDRLADRLGEADGDAGRAHALSEAVASSVPADWVPDPAVVRAVEQLRSFEPGVRAADLDTGDLGGR